MTEKPYSPTPRFWTCAISECTRASAIALGDCERCSQHYCAVHLESPFHTCGNTPLDDDTWLANQEKELRDLRGSINDEALLRKGSQLNHGRSCTFDQEDPLGRSKMGGMHVHLRIRFNDGTAWLMRILRRNFTSFSDELSNHILTSECATMQWLHERGIPVPKLHGFGLRNDPSNDVGVAYMLVDELPGTPFSLLRPSPEQRRKVLGGWTDVLCKLHDHPLPQIGSLTFGASGNVRVGPTAGDRSGTLTTLNPFDSAEAYYAAWCEEHLKLIADRQLFVRFPVNAYLIFSFLKEEAERGTWSDFGEDADGPPFFLKHMDDKGDHILVDEDFNVTGVIDWTFARAVPVYEAFGPSLTTADMNDIFSGQVKRTEADGMIAEALRERDPGLVRYAESVDKIRRITFALGAGMDVSWGEALDMFNGIVKVLSNLTDGFEWSKWREEYLSRCERDQRLQRLIHDIKTDSGVAIGKDVEFS